MKYRVFFGCSHVEAANCSDPFESKAAAQVVMRKEAYDLAKALGVDTNSSRFKLTEDSYSVTADDGATYSGALIPAEEPVMTYRQKAEKMLIERMGVSEYTAGEIIRLLEREGEYTPRVFGALNATPDAEEWDEVAPESED